MLGGSSDSVERKIKRLNSIRAEYESDLQDLKKRLKNDTISKERYERLAANTHFKIEKILAQVKKLRHKKEEMG